MFAVILRCGECESAWLPADEERWSAYLGDDNRRVVVDRQLNLSLQ